MAFLLCWKTPFRSSIVSKDVPPFTVAQGNPAKVVADIAEMVRKNYAPEEFERLLEERKRRYKI